MVCALYIPEVQFANVLTMEPIVLQYVPHDRFNKVSTPAGPRPGPLASHLWVCPLHSSFCLVSTLQALRL